MRSGKQPKVLFATQAANRPPTFVLFTSGFLEAGYRRFIERRLREDFDFTGSPVRVNVRVREKRGAQGTTRTRGSTRGRVTSADSPPDRSAGAR